MGVLSSLGGECVNESGDQLAVQDDADGSALTKKIDPQTLANGPVSFWQ
jgi:hypothetical protein